MLFLYGGVAPGPRLCYGGFKRRVDKYTSYGGHSGIFFINKVFRIFGLDEIH